MYDTLEMSGWAPNGLYSLVTAASGICAQFVIFKGCQVSYATVLTLPHLLLSLTGLHCSSVLTGESRSWGPSDEKTETGSKLLLWNCAPNGSPPRDTDRLELSECLLQVREELVSFVELVKKTSSGLRSGLQAKRAELKTALQELAAERQKSTALQSVHVSCCVLLQQQSGV